MAPGFVNRAVVNYGNMVAVTHIGCRCLYDALLRADVELHIKVCRMLLPLATCFTFPSVLQYNWK